MRSRTILIVDDEEDLREALMLTFQLSQWQVLTAANGKEALTILTSESNNVHTMLSDIRMPQMDGLELLKQIRQLQLVVPRIVMFTGYSSITEREVQDLGANCLVLKPFDPALLVDKIEKLYGE